MKYRQQESIAPLALREKEAAKVLGISPRKLWELANRGEIKAIKVDGVKLYPIRELNRWLDEQIGGGA